MNRQGIEGIADHLKVVAFETVSLGDRYLDLDGGPRVEVFTWEESQRSGYPYTKVEPDNVYNVCDLADVNIPEGYEFVEFRATATGDSYITKTRELFVGSCGADLGSNGRDGRRIIVKPVVKKTRRVLVVEQEIPEDFKVDSVVAVEYDICSPDLTLNYFIEHREVKN